MEWVHALDLRISEEQFKSYRNAAVFKELETRARMRSEAFLIEVGRCLRRRRRVHADSASVIALGQREAGPGR